MQLQFFLLALTASPVLSSYQFNPLEHSAGIAPLLPTILLFNLLLHRVAMLLELLISYVMLLYMPMTSTTSHISSH